MTGATEPVLRARENLAKNNWKIQRYRPLID